jgi:hypothetical protein
VKKLHLTATDAIKSKEDTEIKCQNKIADMVALMEKHKVKLSLGQYPQITPTPLPSYMLFVMLSMCVC